MKGFQKILERYTTVREAVFSFHLFLFFFYFLFSPKSKLQLQVSKVETLHLSNSDCRPPPPGSCSALFACSTHSSEMRRGFLLGRGIPSNELSQLYSQIITWKYFDFRSREMALVSVNNPSNNELVSATSGQVALQQVWFINISPKTLQRSVMCYEINLNVLTTCFSATGSMFCCEWCKPIVTFRFVYLGSSKNIKPHGTHYASCRTSRRYL